MQESSEQNVLNKDESAEERFDEQDKTSSTISASDLLKKIWEDTDIPDNKGLMSMLNPQKATTKSPSKPEIERSKK